MFTERQKRTTWLRAICERTRNEFDANAEARDWEVLRQHCRESIEDCDLSDNKLSAWDLASAADLLAYYDHHYRTYCMFTHGHLEAAMGKFDPITDSEDNLIVCLCGLGAVMALCSIGATSANIDSLNGRLTDLARSSEKTDSRSR